MSLIKPIAIMATVAAGLAVAGMTPASAQTNRYTGMEAGAPGYGYGGYGYGGEVYDEPYGEGYPPYDYGRPVEGYRPYGYFHRPPVFLGAF